MNIWIDSQLAECDCNLCGLETGEFLYERPDGLKVVQCNRCGLVYLNPRPKDELVPVLYGSDYFSSQSSIGFVDYFSDEVHQGMLITSQRRLLILEERNISVSGKVLEIGCATGEFCHTLQKKGLNVTGIDISASVVAEARSRYQLIDFNVGTIDDVDSGVKYDAIFAHEVIEHLTDPDSFFRKASQLLENNGFLCVTTPSFECAEKVGFGNWKGFSTSLEHLYFYTSATINKYAVKYGMQVTCSLYGGGKGLDSEKNKPSRIKKTIRQVLSAMHLLKFVRNIRSTKHSINHGYQSKEIQHNLFMVLRKGTE